MYAETHADKCRLFYLVDNSTIFNHDLVNITDVATRRKTIPNSHGEISSLSISETLHNSHKIKYIYSLQWSYYAAKYMVFIQTHMPNGT